MNGMQTLGFMQALGLLELKRHEYIDSYLRERACFPFIFPLLFMLTSTQIELWKTEDSFDFSL